MRVPSARLLGGDAFMSESALGSFGRLDMLGLARYLAVITHSIVISRCNNGRGVARQGLDRQTNCQ